MAADEMSSELAVPPFAVAEAHVNVTVSVQILGDGMGADELAALLEQNPAAIKRVVAKMVQSAQPVMADCVVGELDERHRAWVRAMARTTVTGQPVIEAIDPSDERADW